LTPKTPPALKSEDASLKEKFLTAKNTLPSSLDEVPIRAANPATSNIKPLATPNSEISHIPNPIASVESVPKQETQRATPPTPAPTEYTLSAGDNLYAVSRRFQVSYNDLMDANGITDPRQLRIGQKLKLPERKTDSTCAL
jgi:LysM repeat protein